MPAPAIAPFGLTKFYGRNRGIDDLSICVERGEVFGFLGPNGAGKSTTIRAFSPVVTDDDRKPGAARPSTAGPTRVLGPRGSAHRRVLRS